MAARAAGRIGYRSRIQTLVSNPPTAGSALSSEAELLAHWAKYCCVLISGYIEQATKEIYTEFAEKGAPLKVSRYVRETWNNSKNMKCDAIKTILHSFDEEWGREFEAWVSVDERKKEINEIITWRNHISHGEEAKTNNVTLHSVKSKLRVAIELVDFLETLVA